jgi:hypothetical protein
MQNPPVVVLGSPAAALAKTSLVALAPPAAAFYFGGGPLAAAGLGAAVAALAVFGERTSQGGYVDPGMEVLAVPINAGVSFGLWHLLNGLVK